MKEQAKRYNKGKLRYDLVPAHALSKVVEVYTKGAHKYSLYKNENGEVIRGDDVPFEKLQELNLEIIDDGANNWRKGQKWTLAMASVERHIALWKQGIDIDPDPSMQTYHLSNAAWGLLSLLEYYKIAPEFDDRPHSYLQQPKISLDVDELVCDWLGGWIEQFGMDVPENWFFDRKIQKRFKKLKKKGKLDDFYLSLKPLINPSDIPFEPHCYVTSRPVKTKITEKWLDDNGFPARPVYSVGVGESKVEVLKKAGAQWHIDDRFENFTEVNNAGICGFLMDRPHNRRYNVGFKRIKSLKDLVW